jgi:hypothetical protein
VFTETVRTQQHLTPLPLLLLLIFLQTFALRVLQVFQVVAHTLVLLVTELFLTSTMIVVDVKHALELVGITERIEMGNVVM